MKAFGTIVLKVFGILIASLTAGGISAAMILNPIIGPCIGHIAMAFSDPFMSGLGLAIGIGLGIPVLSFLTVFIALTFLVFRKKGLLDI